MYFVLSYIFIVNRVVSGEIYTAGKKFTLPPAVTAVTNILYNLCSNGPCVCLSLSEFKMVLVDQLLEFQMVLLSACHCQMDDATDLLIADEEAIEGETQVYGATQS